MKKTLMTLAALLLVFASPAPAPQPAPASATPPSGNTSNCLAPPFLVKQGATAYTTPKDILLTRQADANCFAWQEFISLSWTASSKMRGQPDTTVQPQMFGTPNDKKAVVWETYKESDEVFLANAATPKPWNSWPGGTAAKTLGGMKSEVDPEPILDLSDIGQASQGSPWLTAQNHYLTLYERRMNEDEFNYIVQNKLYDADVQLQYVTPAPVPPTTTNPTPTPTPPIGISLPDGTAATSGYGPLGSIETKAAWIQLDDPKDWPRYKTSKALVKYPGDTKPRTVTVGLVGLHIIHKTALGQQFIWATFEHVDNCPDKDEVSLKTATRKYTYYSAHCNPKTDAYQCKINANPSTYNPKKPYNAPIQTVRMTPIATRPNDDVVGLNQYVWAQIRATNPKSVYLNYMLVNTLWSNQATTIAPGARVPLFAGQLSPAPQQEPVSNATLETYVQNLTCLACHASAPIASVTPQSTTKIFDTSKPADATHPYAADYSFLFDNAQQPSSNKGNH